MLISLLLPISVVGEPCRTTVGEPCRTTVGELCRTTVGEPCRTTVASTGSATRESVTEPSSVTEPVEVTDTTGSPHLFPFNDNEATRYTVAITFKNASFSGICVVKRIDGIIAGSVVNEFGIRAFDFKMSGNRRRVKLLNAMKPLDKCLIRKAIAHDLKRLFRAKTTDEYVSVVDGGTIVMQCPDRRYSFSKINIPE